MFSVIVNNLINSLGSEQKFSRLGAFEQNKLWWETGGQTDGNSCCDELAQVDSQELCQKFILIISVRTTSCCQQVFMMAGPWSYFHGMTARHVPAQQMLSVRRTVFSMHWLRHMLRTTGLCTLGNTSIIIKKNFHHFIFKTLSMSSRTFAHW